MAFFDTRTDEELEEAIYGSELPEERRAAAARYRRRRAARLAELRTQYRFWLPILDESNPSNRAHAGRELADILRKATVAHLH